MKTLLCRWVDNSHIRYYKLSMLLTLFGKYMVEREYGNVAYKKAAGRRVDYFSNKKRALEFYDDLLISKTRRECR